MTEKESKKRHEEIRLTRNGIDTIVLEKEREMWEKHKRLNGSFSHIKESLDLFIEAGKLAKEIIQLREAQQLIR